MKTQNKTKQNKTKQHRNWLRTEKNLLFLKQTKPKTFKQSLEQLVKFNTERISILDKHGKVSASILLSVAI